MRININFKEILKVDYKKNAIFIVILFALLLRIIFFIAAKPWDDQVVQNEIIFSDAAGYHRLALNILDTGSFSDLGDLGANRTPGYPLFVSIIYFIFGVKPWVVLFFQVLLNIVSLIMVYKLGKIMFSKKIAIIAAVLFAIDPHQILYTTTLLTETLFVTIFLVSIFFLIYGLNNKKILFLILSSLFLGFATLIRPISQFFPAIVLLVILIYPKIGWALRLRTSIYYILIFLFTISPWLYRNYSKFGYASLSSIQGESLLFWFVSYTEVERTGKSIDQVRKEFSQKAKESGADENGNPFYNSKIYSEIAIEYLKTNWPDYISRHLKGTINLYISIGTKGILKKLGLKSSDLNFDLYNSPNIFKMIIGFIKSKSLIEILIGLSIGGFLLICYTSFIWGCINMTKDKKYFYLIIFIAIIAYFLILLGVFGSNRYKVPITPFYIVIAANGLYDVYKRINFRNPETQKPGTEDVNRWGET